MSKPVADITVRERKVRETRARIAEAALDQFVSRGFVETTIDQIAEAAGVSRRTVFRHFATKEAILFDHLAVRRDFAVTRLQERPPSEPPLVSLHSVLRELCEQGYERRLLNQIRQVLALEPRFAGEQLLLGFRAFEEKVLSTLESRGNARYSTVDILALTEMAESWFLTATRLYFKRGERSLVQYFDEVVAGCLRASVDEKETMLRQMRGPRARRAGLPELEIPRPEMVRRVRL
jgi:AcrR family transcriptional regulator